MKLLFVDATPGFTPDRKLTKPCGGILTSLGIIPRYLAQNGFDVTVKSDFSEKSEVDGVKYVPLSDKELLPKWDVSIINRNGINHGIVNYSHSIGAKVVWWLHDIVDFRYLEDSSYRNIDKIVALSQYCKTSFADFYDIPDEKFVVIPNGVDKTVFFPGKYEDRKKYRLMMASALIKGYTPVYDTWANVKRQFPYSELVIYSSQSLHEKENSTKDKDWLNSMEEVGAKVQQPVPQNILAEKMRGAWALLMPNSYPEICSNLLLQARACGLPVISSNIGSAAEFIENLETGILTKYAPHDLFLWVKKYVEATAKLFGDDKLHKRISENAPNNILSWDEIGKIWADMLETIKK